MAQSLPIIPSDPASAQQRRQRDTQVNERLRSLAGVAPSPGGYIHIDASTKIAWQSASGHWWGVTMDNTGHIVTTDLGTTPP